MSYDILFCIQELDFTIKYSFYNNMIDIKQVNLVIQYYYVVEI